MTSLFRRLAVPLVGACLLVIIIVVALVVLDLGGSVGDGAASPTAIQIGDISPDQEEADTTSAEPSASTTLEPPLGTQGSGPEPESGPNQGQGQGPDTMQGHTGGTGFGSTVCSGRTTIVTEGIRIQQRLGRQDGPTTTSPTDTVGPASPGTDEGTTTTSDQSTDGGMHGTPSTRHGR